MVRRQCKPLWYTSGIIFLFLFKNSN